MPSLAAKAACKDVGRVLGVPLAEVDKLTKLIPGLPGTKLQKAIDTVPDLGELYKSNPQIKQVRVEGHTDSRGSDDYNLKLSQERAGAVRDFLIEYGIAADRLTSVGHGETKPVADNDTSSGRDRNRRVEFNIVRTENNDAVNVKEAQ